MKPLSKSSFRLHIVALVFCLGLVAYLLPQVIENWGKPPQQEKRIVQVMKRYHWKIDSTRYLPTGDPNVMIAISYPNPNPEITKMKKGEEVDQESNWQAMENAKNNFFKN